MLGTKLFATILHQSEMRQVLLFFLATALISCQHADEHDLSDTDHSTEGAASWQRDFAPAYSPDGVYIAFYSYREEGDNGDVYLLHRKTGEVRRLTTDSTYDIEPKWSPDSREIAYTVSEDMRVLRTAFIDVQGQPTREPIAGGITTWAQSGARIAINKRDGQTFAAEFVDLDTNARHPVPSPEGAGFVGPWTSGLTVAFYTQTMDDQRTLYTFDMEAGTSRKLTDGLHVQDKAWSHGGTDVCLVATVNEQTDLYSMRADGSQLRRLTHSPEGESMCAWSPDGQHIAYSRPEGESMVLYEINVETGEEQRLAE